MRRLVARLAAVMLLLLAATAAGRADVVLDANALLLDAIRAGRISPPAASRFIAMLNVAVFDSVNAATGLPYQPYSFEGMPATDADPASAASAAAAGVIDGLFPELARSAPALGARLAQLAAQAPPEPRHSRGAALGRACAAAVLAARARDGAEAADIAFAGSTTPGAWRPASPGNAPALLPGWGRVRPWAIPETARFAPAPPPALGSVAWTDSYGGVKSLGSPLGAGHQEEHTIVARFWSDEEGTETPPGHWIAIASAIAGARNQGLAENARLFALLGITLADVAVVVWDAKYHFATWRPVTAIREAARIGNPRILGDPDWSPVLGTPPFPEYPSGHSAFSAAAARMLALFYGTDEIAVDVTTHAATLPGMSRHFDRLSDAAEEAGLSRIYGGIHFYFSHAEASATGRRVAEFIFAQRLQPSK